jgi:hypothetical protein
MDKFLSSVQLRAQFHPRQTNRKNSVAKAEKWDTKKQLKTVLVVFIESLMARGNIM